MTQMTENSTNLAVSLRRLDALESLDDDQIETLAAVARSRRFAAGETIYEEGSEGTDFLFIQSGTVDAFRETPLGSQRVATLDEGELCGEISLLDGKPRSTSIIGVQPGVILAFDATAIAHLTTEDRKIEVAFLQIFCRSLARKTRQANLIMTEIMAPDAINRRQASGTLGESLHLDEETKRTLLRQEAHVGTDLQELATFLEAQRFSAGDPIFVEGESGDTLYIIADGQVRISRHIPGLGEEAIAILDPGEVFGEMAWIDDRPRSADAIAHTGGCTVLGITGRQLDGTLSTKDETHTRFLKLICQILSRRIRRMNDQLVAYRTLAFF
ncbi:MAG: cyclic nucleotide-binding domain-containing protein [Thermoanaerobaculales bacterium]|nr:cyclic nucleotide-binding domain-containing protein [Thermoanaerobaculales bacterium]